MNEEQKERMYEKAKCDGLNLDVVERKLWPSGRPPAKSENYDGCKACQKKDHEIKELKTQIFLA